MQQIRKLKWTNYKNKIFERNNITNHKAIRDI